MGGDALAEQALALIDEEPARVEGRVDPGHVQWRRAQVDTRLKLLACWNPKKYGAKQQTEISGPDGGAVKTEATLTPEQLASLTEALINQTTGK